MTNFDDHTRRAIDLALGHNDPVRSIIEGIGRQDMLSRAGLYGSGASEMDAISRAANAFDRFERESLALTAGGMHRDQVGKLYDPYAGLPASLSKRIHDEITAAQDSLFGVGRFGADAARLAEERKMLSLTHSSARWAMTVLDHQDELQRLIGIRDTRDFATTLTVAHAITSEIDRLDPLAIGSNAITAGTRLAEHGSLRDTMTKMSAFAGALATTGPASASTLASTYALLGEWQTLPDLEPNYWRDPVARTRFYRDADVDPGVIDTDNNTLIDVLVESGMVEGGRTRGGNNVAIIQAGAVRVQIGGRRARSGTFEAIDTLDSSLKALIDRTLTAEVGERWFVQNVDGKIVPAAKERRQAALLAGEEPLPLVYYLDLGQLIDIVRDKRHWRFFEPIFLDSDAFAVNMRRLNTIRRPTMHGRGIDQVQILEAVVLVHRFTQAMTRTGTADAGWDDDI